MDHAGPMWMNKVAFHLSNAKKKRLWPPICDVIFKPKDIVLKSMKERDIWSHGFGNGYFEWLELFP